VRAELAAMVQHRPALGLRHRRPAQGHFYVDHRTGKLVASESAYEHPQPHACFIQGVADDLVNEGGIMDLWVREARPVQIRLRHRLELLEAARRERKTVGRRQVLRPDEFSQDRRPGGRRDQVRRHDAARGEDGGGRRRPSDIEQYIDWKVKEEQKVAALVAGSKACHKHLRAIHKACVNCEGEGDACFEPEKNPALKREIKLARRAFVPDNLIKRVIQMARQGDPEPAFDTYDTDWDSEAYATVSGQNSNNSVRVTDAYLRAVEADEDWALTARLTGKPVKTLKARELWQKSATPPGPRPIRASSSTPR
jgi:ribonucleoside-diphosphate reductase alpha chain